MLKKIFGLLTISTLLIVWSGCSTADPATQDLPWSGRGDKNWMYAPPGLGGMNPGGY